MTAISDLLSANQVNALRKTNGFRLTLTSGSPLPTNDVSGVTTLYMTPYLSNQICLYVDGAWIVKETAEISVSTSGIGGYKCADVFAYWTGSAVALELIEWTNDTTRATAIVQQDGVWVKSGDATRRYIGTCRTSSNPGQVADVAAARFLWNLQNQVMLRGYNSDSTAHSYTVSSWRPWNNSLYSTAVEFIVGLPTNVYGQISGSVTTSSYVGYLTLNMAGASFGNVRGASFTDAGSSHGWALIAPGYNLAYAWEYGGTGFYLYNTVVSLGIMG